MNYIRQVNAFYDWLLVNSMPSSSIALWHALMCLANKSGWAPEFNAATSALGVMSGLERRQVERSRNMLKQAGLIDWKSRKGNQAASYKVIALYDKKRVMEDAQAVDLCVTEDAQTVAQKSSKEDLCVTEDAQTVAQHVAQHVAQIESLPIRANTLSTCSKQNETKQNIRTARAGGDLETLTAHYLQKTNASGNPSAAQKLLAGLLEKYEADEIREKIDVIASRTNIRVPSAALKTALKEDWSPTEPQESPALQAHRQKYAAFYEGFPSAFAPK